MIRTTYTPDSNNINVSIPDRYVGIKLEITVSPIKEVLDTKTENIINEFIPEKTAEEIIAEIRESRRSGGRIIEPFD